MAPLRVGTRCPRRLNPDAVMNDWIYVHDLDPIIFHLGPLRVGWYGVMYALAFLSGYFYLQAAAKRPGAIVDTEEVPNLLTYIILGVVLGGRLGWVLFYGGLPYFMEPWRILETWKGGMSFHGGLIGVILAMVLYARRHRLSLVALADLIVLWVPVGLFLGRIGNFINGELYGKPTDGTWGVIFPGDPRQVPRHPSQLYEAGLEGVAIFLVLLVVRRFSRREGVTTATFLLCYGMARFAVEFVRLPDADIGYLWRFVTMGQVLSMPMILVGGLWLVWIYIRPGAETPTAPAAEAAAVGGGERGGGRGKSGGKGKRRHG